MGAIRSMRGTIRVSLTSADLAGALSAVNMAGIRVFAATQEDDLTLALTVYRRDYPALKKITQRRGERLKLLRRQGVYWTAKGMLRRPLLLAGLLFLLALVLFLPSRVLFVRVEGNTTIPTRLILEQADACGIGFGASRRAVRSEKMKNALLEAVPELQWAGVNTSGCVAIITVRERTAAGEEQEISGGVSSIVASRDGIIRTCTVVKGNSLCKVGQAVLGGQVLVSGYTDCGISIRATRAEAEIYAETQWELAALTPGNCLQRGAVQRQVKKYSILIGKNRINLYNDSSILDGSCVKMYSENFLTLPGGFSLPVAIVEEVWIYYDSAQIPVSQTRAESLLADFVDRYLPSQMIAGQILTRQETVSQGDGVYTLSGQYACLEMIGREQSEEIIKGDGKND